MSVHRKSLHGGVASTLVEVKSLFWITVFRKLTKFVRQNFYGCKQFKATRYANLKSGLLPRNRTEQIVPIEIIGADHAGPLHYKSKGKIKAYILLFSCSVSRSVHLELVSNFSTTEFIKCFK